MSRELFKRRANRLCIWFPDYGDVPLACSEKDDAPVFESAPPQRIGDDAIVHVEGQRRMVRLLRSFGGGAYLVDMGQAPDRRF